MTDQRDTLITDIARRFLGVGTLEPRGRDALDFHSLGVLNIKQALERAYEAGRTASPAPPTTYPCPACGRAVTITPVPTP